MLFSLCPCRPVEKKTFEKLTLRNQNPFPKSCCENKRKWIQSTHSASHTLNWGQASLLGATKWIVFCRREWSGGTRAHTHRSLLLANRSHPLHSVRQSTEKFAHQAELCGLCVSKKKRRHSSTKSSPDSSQFSCLCPITLSALLSVFSSFLSPCNCI